MSEKLLLRKGLYANLENLAVEPGAISITTDEPGIYIDLAADASHNAAYRVRIGDFISFSSLQALKDESNKYPVGQTKVYSEHALYYAETENVLCKYVPDDNGGHFVWINDTSDLLSRIVTLEGTVGSQGTSISNILQTIGSSNHDATKGKTVYQAIEAEYTRATAAESGLQDQIDAIIGESGEGSSITGILETIDKLDKAYKEADTGINTTITNLKGDGYNNETVHGNAVNIASNTDRIKAIEDKNIESGAEVNIIEAIGVTISGDADPSVNIDGDRKANITLPKNLTKYDGTGKLNAIDQSITGINSTITDEVKGSGWGADNKKPSLMSNLGAIDAINSKLSGIESGAQVNKIEKIKVALDTPAASDGLSISNKEVTIKIPSTLAHIGAEQRVAKIETDITTINETTIPSAINTAKGYTNTEIAKLDGQLRDAINDALAGADAMTFIGAIGYNSDGNTPKLPTSGVKCGDTYVLSSESLNHVYHPGDMLIALKDQTTESYPSGIVNAGAAADVTDTSKGWFHVKTGYEGNHEAKISVIPDTVNGGTTTATGNKIALTSHVAPTGSYGDLGTVEFTTASSNIEITKTAGQTGAINFNLVWATF